jgi:A/G-specific adenine glycosylase
MNDFAAILLSWFRENGRELPWRGTKDPYAIWLSEIILQQTQVKQGWDYWERFMRRWPTVEALAAATEDEVLREWQGLGYYSRARNLHTAAQQIVARGAFPTTIEGIKQLKGVGDYTAAAIGSIAFGLPAAVVDGNVYRVLSRYYGISTPINTTEGKKEFQALAQSLLPTENGELPTENGERRTERCDYFQDRKTPQQANHTSQFSPLSSQFNQASWTSAPFSVRQPNHSASNVHCRTPAPPCVKAASPNFPSNRRR